MTIINNDNNLIVLHVMCSKGRPSPCSHLFQDFKNFFAELRGCTIFLYADPKHDSVIGDGRRSSYF